MAVRSLLLLVFLANIAAAAEPTIHFPATRSTGEVVRFGSPALAVDSGCRAVGFTPDGRGVCVFADGGWHRWDIATGRRLGDTKLSPSQFTKETFAPTPSGRAVLRVGYADQVFALDLLDTDTAKVIAGQTVSSTYDLQRADDGRSVAVGYPGHTRIVWLDAVRPDDRIADVTHPRGLSASTDGTVIALLADDQAVVRTAAGLWRPGLAKDATHTVVTVTADGTTLAIASAVETSDGKRPGPIELWDVAGRKKLRTLEAVEWYAEAPTRLRFTPDGRTLVAGDGAYLRGWSTATGAKTFAVEPGWGWTGNIQVSPDGAHVAVTCPGRPMVYELATGRQPAALLAHTGPVWEAVVSPDGRRVATAMFGQPAVYVWDAATGRSVGMVEAAFARPAEGRLVPGGVRLRFSPDGTKLLTASEATGADTRLRVWDVASGGLLRELPTPARGAATPEFTRAGLFAVLDGRPTLADAADGRTAWAKAAGPRGANLLVSPDGGRVAVEGRKEASVWDAADGREVARVPGEPVRFTLGGAGLVFTGKDSAVRFRDLAEPTDRPVCPNAGGLTPAVSDTGLVGMPFVTSNQDAEFRIVTAHDGRPVGKCEQTHYAGSNEPPRATFSPDGRTLAVGSLGRVRLFETYSGEMLAEANGQGAIRVLLFAPDGRTAYCSRGSDEQFLQLVGYDATGGAWRPPVVPRADEIEPLYRAMGGKPATSRQALYRLATRPAEAVAFARAATKLATPADVADYARWLTELDAPAFATREAATKGLAKGGWRAEGQMRRTLDTTASAETRHRLEKLLDKRDMRPLRAVHLLEVVGTPEAVSALRTLADGPAGSLVVQDARWALHRLKERAGR